ncbi:MAG: helix-turn-helix domain-containing protein [Hyphomicrobiales bacterium]
MAKRANPRAVKINLTYTIEEAADCLNVSIGTIRAWIKNGLHVFKSQKPYLIPGFELRNFLEKQRQTRKMPMADDELLCLKCRKPQKTLGAMADYFPSQGSSGRLVGFCAVCEGVSHRFVSPAKLADFKAVLDISIRSDGQD